jgi:S-DNA-T family DNA segregation ATPase FtsK/SpoIIIE
VWNVGELFDFPALVESWKQRRQTLNHFEARAVLQLKFVVTLEFETINNVTDRAAAQFIRRYNPQWVASEFVNDWDRLAAHPAGTSSTTTRTGWASRRSTSPTC